MLNHEHVSLFFGRLKLYEFGQYLKANFQRQTDHEFFIAFKIYNHLKYSRCNETLIDFSSRAEEKEICEFSFLIVSVVNLRFMDIALSPQPP